MPGLKDAPVPDYESDDKNVVSKQSTEFVNDVFIYGKLYADITGEDISFDENTTFGSITIEDNLWVGGLSTFIGPVDMDYLTVRQRLDVGVGGTVFTAISTTNGYNGEGQTGGRVGIGSTQPSGRFEVGIGGATLDPLDPLDPFKSSLIVTDQGDVGIGTTQPDGKFQVGNECFTIYDDCTASFVGNVGIGTTQPVDAFQIGFSKDDGQPSQDTFVVSGVGSVGIGTTIVGGDWTVGNTDFNETSKGKLKLDVDGSIHIARNIYDSAGSPGGNGFFLNQDANGIRWVSFEPDFSEGVFVQDEGTYIPTTGVAQSFTVFNYTQINSQGQGVDNIIPIPNPSNPTQIVDIQSMDYWGHTGGGDIFRMTKVGINENNPSAQLDITGTVHATGNVDFDSQLNVDGNTTLGGTLTVEGITRFNDQTDSTSISNGSVQMDGGVGITKNLNVGGNTDVAGTLNVDSATTLNNTLDVDGATTLNDTLDVDGKTTFNDQTDASSTTSASVQMDGGVGIVKKLFVGGITKVEDQTQSTTKDDGALIVEGGVGIEKNVNIGQNTKVGGSFELDGQFIDFFDDVGVGVCKTDYRLSSFNVTGVGAGVSWRPSGVQTKRTIWVTKNGCDTNSGLLEGDAKYTIGAAVAIANEGDTVKVRSGIYYENNPIGLRDDVAVSGEDLRLVTLVPNNPNRDFFHVRRGCLVENLSFAGASHATDHTGCGAVAFPPTQDDINNGNNEFFQAINGYTAFGPANEGASGRFKSPYVRNCTNFMTGSIGMRINGRHCDANFTGTNNLGQDIKSMVCDSFTQYNEQGIGVSLSHNAYAQLVSIFTIGCDVGIAATSGGQCDLTNSNSSFGNVGLKADGYGAIEFEGILNASVNGESDVIVSRDTKDEANNFRIPFDGQGAYFHLDMDDYNDSTAPNGTIVTDPLQLVRGIRVVNGGNPGEYFASSPPIITLSDTPQGPESILPEFSPNVSAAGTITSVDVINSGRNFLPGQSLTVNISGSGSAQLEVDMDPILFTVSEATDAAAVTGLSTITFNEFIPYPISSNTPIKLVRLSRIITSSHSFEYIGAGTDLNTANPFQGGKPIPEQEVVAINGGQVPFTSTDQKGNFRIGDGLTIDQTTSTIRGRDFNRAIQAQLTPLILALR